MNMAAYNWVHLQIMRADFHQQTKQYLIVEILPMFIANKIMTNNLDNIVYKTIALLVWFVMTIVISFDVHIINLIPVIIISYAGVYVMFLVRRKNINKTLKNEYKLNKTIERLKALLDIYINDNIVVLDVYIKHILFSNIGFQQTFSHGETTEENEKKDLKYVLNRIEVEEEGVKNKEAVYLWELLEVLRENAVKDVYQTNCRYQIENGEYRTFRVRIAHYKWDQTRSFVLIFTDVSEQQILKELQENEQNQDYILDVFAHELRTPIKNMHGALNLLVKEVNEKLGKDNPYMKYISMCQLSCKYLLSVSNTFLDMARVKQNSLKINIGAFSLNKLLTEVKGMFECQVADKGLKLELEVSPQIPDKIVNDRDKLEQILLSILTNSLSFTVSGSIKIAAKLDPSFPDSIEISVSDTGKGIHHSDQHKLLKMYPFLEKQKKSGNSEGFGLGIYVAQNLVRLLAENDDTRGIRVDSILDRGSKFTFSITTYRNNENLFVDFQHPMLPDEKEPGDQSLAIPRPSHRVRTSQRQQPKLMGKLVGMISTPNLDATEIGVPLDKTYSAMNSIHPSSIPDFSDFGDDLSILHVSNSSPLLIVDDNPIDLMLICQQLDEMKISYKTARGGEACLDAVDEAMSVGQSFRGILLDCYMPDLNGFQTAKILKARMSRKEVPETPIIAISAHDNQENREKAFKAGMIAWYTKPIREDDILELLESCVKAWKHNARRDKMMEQMKELVI